MRGEIKPIWLNEDLIKPREALNFHARQLYRQKQLLSNWTYGGEIYVKTAEGSEPIKVNNLSELREAAGLPPSHTFDTTSRDKKDYAFSSKL